MKIDKLILGEFETNCYILRSSDSAKECLLIDAGLEAGGLIDLLRERKLKPAAVVITHGHIDHIGGLNELRKNYPDIKVYIHKIDADMLSEPYSNLSAMAGASYTSEPANFLIEEPYTIEQAGINLSVIHTAGHTPGGICLYSENEGVIFVGDTLFAESVGRTDFPCGNMNHLIKNIKEKLLALPDDTIVYPGHGPATTIGQEKKSNPFL